MRVFLGLLFLLTGGVLCADQELRESSSLQADSLDSFLRRHNLDPALADELNQFAQAIAHNPQLIAQAAANNLPQIAVHNPQLIDPSKALKFYVSVCALLALFGLVFEPGNIVFVLQLASSACYAYLAIFDLMEQI